MPLPSSLFLLAVSAGTLQTNAVVRSGCGEYEREVASLPAGLQVEIRSALNGESGMCYKVAAEHDGKQVIGYVPASALKSAEAFDQARKQARGFGGSAGATGADVASAVQKATAKVGREHPASKAMSLIEANQPEEALRLLEKDLQRYPTDPYLHAVAGLAYYRTDSLERAMLHWKESLSIEANPAIEAMIQRAEREKNADKGSERMVGNRVVLRYERSTVNEPLARSMLDVLDQEYTRVSFQLGCRANEKVTAIAQSRASYVQSTQAVEWSGGQYDGRIHVPVSDSRQVSSATRRVFAHELVHACLHELGTWPSWLHEGLAQIFSGDSSAGQRRMAIEAMLKEKRLPKLSQLGRNWSQLNSAQAGVAYDYALYAAEKLLEITASTGIGNVLRNPSGFSAVEADLEKRLGL